MKKFSFLKRHRITKRDGFELVLKYGDKKEIKDFIIYSKKNNLDRARLGIKMSKKIGKAVKRNKIKRYLREWFRLNREELKLSQDIIIKPKIDAIDLSYFEVQEELNRGIKNQK